METAIVEKPVAKTARPAPKPVPPDDKPPRVDLTHFTRLTESAEITFWGWLTEHDLSDLLVPGYFDGAVGICRDFDRIVFTCSSAAAGPVHGTLIVSKVTQTGVVVKVLARSDRD